MGLLDEEIITEMSKVIRNLEGEYGALRTSRATPHLLDKISVDYYGAQTALKQVANISIPEAREILIVPFDRSMLKEIERSIQSSDLGLSPNNDGKNIRLSIPALTTERRKDLVKQAKGMAEKAKISLRSIRRDMNDLIKEDKELSEDQQRYETGEVQRKTDEMVKKVDIIVGQKEKEILEI